MSEKTTEQVSETQGSVVVACSPLLNGQQRRYLRGLGHHLKPVVMVGDKGLHDRVMDQIEGALEDHELIKVKVLGASSKERSTAARAIHERTGAQVAQILGRIILLYSPHPDDPRIVLPMKKGKGGQP